jgi:hypothetical protein
MEILKAVVRPLEMTRELLWQLLGLDKCECVACLQDLTSKDVKPENESEFNEMNRAGLFKDGFGCIVSVMQRNSKLIDMLNVYTSITSAERISAGSALLRNLLNLADQVTFPVECTPQQQANFIRKFFMCFGV